MTAPFTTYAFPTADTGTIDRTLPDRLTEIKNVKDFGAKGDGVTDDWAAIMAAYNWVDTNPPPFPNLRGTIFFPPGTYLVSQAIDTSDVNVSFAFVGVYGASIITGNFDDYIIKRVTDESSTFHTIENLTVINTHATGGGIRLGGVDGAAIRSCTITANKGINTADLHSPALSSFEVSVENCTFRPGAHTSGSLGLYSVSDGPILNCSFVGFDTGLTVTGQQGCGNPIGCRFELCGIGIDVVDGSLVSGCFFKNCGIAINGVGGSCRLSGIRIEGTEGTIAGDPQYGIKLSVSSNQRTTLEGIIVTGQFEHYGIYLSDETYLQSTTLIGVQSFNTSTKGGLAWRLPSTAITAQFINCNVAPVFTMANLPVPPWEITSISWSGGTTTLVVNAAVGNFDGLSMSVTVTGMSPSGYNGTFSCNAAPSTFTLTYAQSDPGAPSGTGSGIVLVNPTPTGGTPNAQEGDCYNVSDANSATWGANPVGGGSTHAKVRWSGTNWVVVGK
jgi:hypothetical protein